MRPSGVLRIAPDIDMGGKRYAGRKTTRKEMQLQPESSEEQQGDADDDGDGDGDDDIVVDDNDEEDGNEEDDDDAMHVQEDNEDEEDEQVDTSGIMEAMAAAQRAELAKAQAVAKQVWQFQRALAVRIRLQAALTAANKLPLRTTVTGESITTSSAAAEAAKEIAQTMGVLARLGGVSAPLPAASASLDEWWQWVNGSVNAAHRVAADEALVEEWNRRTDTSLGGGGGRAFKALGRPVMEQIRYALRNDMARLVRRSQLNRAQCIPLGSDVGDGVAAQHLEHVYDDGDFYGQLLKTFIEASTSAADSALSGPRVLRQQRARHMTRDEKRRRKLNAQMAVQQELLNFMAPLATTQLPPMATALFGSLFG